MLLPLNDALPLWPAREKAADGQYPHSVQVSSGNDADLPQGRRDLDHDDFKGQRTLASGFLWQRIPFP